MTPPSRALRWIGVPALALAMSAASCGGSDSPGAVVEQYYEAIRDDRCRAAFDLLSTQAQVVFRTATGHNTDADIARSYCRIVDVVFDDVRVYPEEPLPTGVVVVKVKLRNTRDGLWVDRAENVAREGGEWRIMKF